MGDFPLLTIRKFKFFLFTILNFISLDLSTVHHLESTITHMHFPSFMLAGRRRWVLVSDRFLDILYNVFCSLRNTLHQRLYILAPEGITRFCTTKKQWSDRSLLCHFGVSVCAQDVYSRCVRFSFSSLNIFCTGEAISIHQSNIYTFLNCLIQW